MQLPLVVKKKKCMMQLPIVFDATIWILACVKIYLGILRMVQLPIVFGATMEIPLAHKILLNIDKVTFEHILQIWLLILNFNQQDNKYLNN